MKFRVPGGIYVKFIGIDGNKQIGVQDQSGASSNCLSVIGTSDTSILKLHYKIDLFNGLT